MTHPNNLRSYHSIIFIKIFVKFYFMNIDENNKNSKY